MPVNCIYAKNRVNERCIADISRLYLHVCRGNYRHGPLTGSALIVEPGALLAVYKEMLDVCVRGGKFQAFPLTSASDMPSMGRAGSNRHRTIAEDS
jgi:hypothetical protein